MLEPDVGTALHTVVWRLCCDRPLGDASSSGDLVETVVHADSKLVPVGNSDIPRLRLKVARSASELHRLGWYTVQESDLPEPPYQGGAFNQTSQPCECRP